jgi:pimeloyl-[acyl-carrier protein] methyl ester esterase
MASVPEVDDQRPRLVLLHGWAMSSAVWNHLLPVLAGRYRIELVDLPGHGRNARIPLEDIEGCVAFLEQMLPERAHLLGWSLGGLVALRFAQRFPDRVTGLSLLASSPSFVRRNGWVHGIEPSVFEAFRVGLASDYQATLRRFLSLQLRGVSEAKTWISELRSQMQAHPPAPGSLEPALRMLEQVDLRDFLQAPPIPVSMLLGDKDTLVPASLEEAYPESLGRVDVSIIQGAGHVPFLTHPESFLEWLNKHVV